MPANEVDCRGPTAADNYYRAPRTEVAAFVPPGTTSLLDVGCGAGAFLEIIRADRPDIRVRGIEPNHKAAQAAREAGLHVTTGTFPQVSHDLGTFDCVVFNDVLEHLVDPWDALTQVPALLTSEGRLVVSIPNLRNIDTILELTVRGDFRYRDAGVLDRTHLRFFTLRSMRRMIEGAGFTVERAAGINRTRSRRHRAIAYAAGLIIPGIRRESPFRQFVLVARPVPLTTVP